MLFDIKKNDTHEPAMYVDEYISVITARILHITMKGIKTFPLYYVSNLKSRVKGSHVKGSHVKGIEEEIIATNFYNVSRYQRKVVTFLFDDAAAGEVAGAGAIVPLTTCIIREYDMSHFKFIPFPIGSVSLIEITKKNISLFTHFIHQNNSFSCVILPELSSIQHLLTNENFYIYGIIQNKELVSVYVFRDTMCIGSIYNYRIIAPTIFVIGFYQALCQIYKRDNTIQKITINNTSHNSYILQYVANANVLREYSFNYFLYNYGCKTMMPNECFLLC